MTQRYLTVTALTKYLKRKIELDPHLQQVWIKGEISNFKLHHRGHMYLTIKDEQSRIQAVMYASDNHYLKFSPENGMSVLIKGYISVFEPYGQYQLYIKEMQPDGVGSLFLAYEQLKEKLSKAGYFDEKHKRPIPTYPKHIGIITSPTGAAIRDIITTIKRRYPIVQITILPVLVQGVDAPESIRQAIEQANQLNSFDLLIVGRGGGSIEDLWSFNEEKVVKAIFQSTIPIISGIGHETDMTISDFVADLRAPTPTGAAELAVPALTELNETISHLQARLSKLAKIHVMRKQEKLQTVKSSYVFHYPKQLLNEKEQHIDRLTDTLINRFSSLYKQRQHSFEHIHKRLTLQHPQNKIEDANKKLSTLQTDLEKRIEEFLKRKESDLYTIIDKLTLLNPLEIMKRGFSVTYNEKGKIARTIEDIQLNEQIQIKLLNGSVDCKVENVRRGYE